MPEEEVEQRFIVVVKGYGDPAKLRDTTLIGLSSALHYAFMPGCLVVTPDGRVHEFLPEAEMGRHHTRVIGEIFTGDGLEWHSGTIDEADRWTQSKCPGRPDGRHCYHHEDDPKVPCCYEQAKPAVENTWQT